MVSFVHADFMMIQVILFYKRTPQYLQSFALEDISEIRNSTGIL